MSNVHQILKFIAGGRNLRGLPWCDLAVLLVIAASADAETGTAAVTPGDVAETIGRPSCVLLADRSLHRLHRGGLVDVKVGCRVRPTVYRLACPTPPRAKKDRHGDDRPAKYTEAVRVMKTDRRGKPLTRAATPADPPATNAPGQWRPMKDPQR